MSGRSTLLPSCLWNRPWLDLCLHYCPSFLTTLNLFSATWVRRRRLEELACFKGQIGYLLAMCLLFVQIVHGHIYKTAWQDLLKHIVLNGTPSEEWRRLSRAGIQWELRSWTSKGEAKGLPFAPVFIHFFNIPQKVLLQRDGHCAMLNGRLNGCLCFH